MAIDETSTQGLSYDRPAVRRDLTVIGGHFKGIVRQYETSASRLEAVARYAYAVTGAYETHCLMHRSRIAIVHPLPTVPGTLVAPLMAIARAVVGGATTNSKRALAYLSRFPGDGQREYTLDPTKVWSEGKYKDGSAYLFLKRRALVSETSAACDLCREFPVVVSTRVYIEENIEGLEEPENALSSGTRMRFSSQHPDPDTLRSILERAVFDTTTGALSPIVEREVWVMRRLMENLRRRNAKLERRIAAYNEKRS